LAAFEEREAQTDHTVLEILSTARHFISFHFNFNFNFIMSMAKYLKSVNKYAEPEPGLPDPNKQDTPVKAKICAAANAEITSPRGQKRKRGMYYEYTPEDWLGIVHMGAEKGPSKAARHFSEVFIAF
jgi:hypothetical protein